MASSSRQQQQQQQPPPRGLSLQAALRQLIVKDLEKFPYIFDFFKIPRTKDNEKDRTRCGRTLLNYYGDWRDEIDRYSQEDPESRAAWIAAATAGISASITSETTATTATTGSFGALPLARHIWKPDGSLIKLIPEQSWPNAIDECCAQSTHLAAAAHRVATGLSTSVDEHADFLLQLWPIAFPAASGARSRSVHVTDHSDDVVRSDFTLPLYGSVVLWLQKYICNANEYDRINPSSIYSKAFPILQSSGTGKTKLAVQLSAEQAGFLVCTRSDEVSKAKHSFPPKDDLVYKFLSQVKAENNHTYHSHRRVACWLGAYFGILAYALEKRMISSGCFGEFPPGAKPQRPHASDLDSHSSSTTTSFRPKACTHPDPEACWKTVVYQLAKAIHDGPDFIERYSFDIPNPPQCPSSKLSHDSPTDVDTSFGDGATDVAVPSPPPFPPTIPVPEADLNQMRPKFESDQRRFRTHVLESIDHLANQLLERPDPAPTWPAPSEPPLNKEALANYAANLYMRPFLERLESLLPERLARTHFFFLVIDEIMPLKPILPILRRLWRAAAPRSTWLMFIDTDSDVAPLAGIQVRLNSARLEFSDNLLVIPPFVDLGFDAVIQHKSRELDVKLRQARLTFSELLSTLSYFGRPLWNTSLYRSIDEPKRPHLENILTKLLTYHQWPNMWPNSTNVASFTDPSSTTFQSIMAIAGQRLPLHFVGHSGVNLVESASATELADDLATSALGSTSMAFLQTLASKYLRVISKLHDNVNFFITSTVSEPALSLAVASLLRGRTNSAEKECTARWSTIVEVLCHAHRAVGLMLGEEGEEGVRLLMSLAADLVASTRVTKESNPSSTSDRTYTKKEQATRFFAAHCDPICLRDWLVTLFGAINLDPWLLEWARQYYLNFTHFLRLGTYVYSDPARQHKQLDWLALAEYWWRQVAVYGQPNQPGWDLVIPIYRSDRPPVGEDCFNPQNVSYIAIQVKNRKSDVTASRFFGPSLRQDDSFDLSSFNHGCLEIFIDLRSPVVLPHRFEKLKPEASRKELKKPPRTRYHLTISGFGSKVFPLIARLTSDAQALLPLLLGHTETDLADSAIRLQLYKQLLTGLPDIELSKSILDGHGPAYFWKPDQRQTQQRSATKFDWTRADTGTETTAGGQDVSMAEG